jgi:hypothetical protein
MLHDQGRVLSWRRVRKRRQAQKPYGSRDERNSWLREGVKEVAINST